APASGKNTYIASHAEPADLIIDLDAIASDLSGQPTHAWDRGKYLGASIRQRNLMLGNIGKPTASWPRAWFIVSEPKPENRQWWADTLKPERIVVLETPPAICIARVKADTQRPRQQTYDAIGKWWDAYGRRDGDEIIRAG